MSGVDADFVAGGAAGFCPADRDTVMRDAADNAVGGVGWGFVGSVQRGGATGNEVGNAIGVFGPDLQGIFP